MARGLFELDLGIALEDLNTPLKTMMHISLEEVQELDTLNAKLSSHTIAVNELTEVRSIVGESIEKYGGLDFTSVGLIRATVENVHTRLKLPDNKLLIPATEAFISKTSRKQAATLAVEKIDFDIKAIIDRLIKFFKDLWEKLLSLFKKNQNNTEVIKKETALLKNEVRDSGVADETLNEVQPEAEEVVENIKEKVADRRTYLRRTFVRTETRLRKKVDLDNSSSITEVSNAVIKATDHIERSAEVINETVDVLSTIFALYKDPDISIGTVLDKHTVILDNSENLSEVIESSSKIHEELAKLLVTLSKGNDTSDKRTNVNEIEVCMQQVAEIGSEAFKQQKQNNDSIVAMNKLQRKNLSKINKKQKSAEDSEASDSKYPAKKKTKDK